MSKVVFRKELAVICDSLTKKMVYGVATHEAKVKIKIIRDMYSQVANLIDSGLDLDEVKTLIEYKIEKQKYYINIPKKAIYNLYQVTALKSLSEKLDEYM